MVGKEREKSGVASFPLVTGMGFFTALIIASTGTGMIEIYVP